MKLRTYRAASMADALARVKHDLGPDAVILHTRAAKVGGLLGFFARSVVEVTASHREALPPQHPAAARQSRTPRTSSPPALQSPQTVQPAGDPGTGALIGTIVEAYRRAGAVLPSTPPTAAPAAPPVPPPAAAEQPAVMPVRRRRRDGPHDPAPNLQPDQPVELIRGELAEIKRMVTHVLRSGDASPLARTPDLLFEHYLRLLEAEVAREIADEVVCGVRDELRAGELSDPEIVRAAVLRRLGALIPTCEHAPAPPARDGRPLTIALVGPTGVGKTTTTAKLAANYRLRQGRRVGLITTDTYRIAAVDQLRTYAQIIGIPLRVVLSPQEVGAAIDSLAGCDVVLIDTAGRSPNAGGRLDELAAHLSAARPHETHLVLSAAASESVLERTVGAFARLSPNRVVLTKLDEAVNFGVVVNVGRRLRSLIGQGGQSPPVSYFTTGQEVPDDLEAGRAERLARMVLENTIGPGERRAEEDGGTHSGAPAVLAGGDP